jgi:hypothetical protein
LVRSRAARATAASATIPTWPSLRVLGQLKALTTEMTSKRWLALRLSRSSPAFVVDRLNSMPFNTLASLVAESERDGLRFVRRLVDEWAAGTGRIDRLGELGTGA